MESRRRDQNKGIESDIMSQELGDTWKIEIQRQEWVLSVMKMCVGLVFCRVRS